MKVFASVGCFAGYIDKGLPTYTALTTQKSEDLLYATADA
jgi:hypothetical protein